MTTIASKRHSEAQLIKFLAHLLRGLHYVVGISVPPAGASDRTFVLMWLGILAFIAAFCMIVLYVIPRLYFG